MRKLSTLAGCAVAAGSVVAAVLTATPTMAAGAAESGTDTVAQDVAASVAWTPCNPSSTDPTAPVCGYLSVPLDHDKPNGTKIKLALSMVKHTVTADKYQGIMLVNPGGPGGSGLGLSVLGKYVPNGAGDAYDWIGFDPRGVGSSVPSLTCIADYSKGPRPEYVPLTPSLEKTWLARSKAYAEACGKNGGELLKHMRTTDVAQDMESIRAAMRVKQINFYGFSYGTYLGQVYSTLFPSKVRRMVLDSNVDPTRVFYQANLDQDIAFERNMKIWWKWVADYDAVYHLGKTEAAVERNWYLEKERLRAKPAGGVVGADEWTDIFLGAGYYQVTWLELAQVWADWTSNHDPAPVVAEYESSDSPTDDNGFAVYNAVQCTDAPWPKSWDTWKRDNWSTFTKAPYETWGNAWFNAPCLYWPAKAGPAVDVDGSKVAPILLIDETLDAATPYGGSLEVRKRFPKSSLIAEPGGTSHADSLFGNACVDDQIAAYLADGTLPKRKPGSGADTTCDPLPVPVPTAATGSASGLAAQASATSRAATLGRLLHFGRE